MLTPDQLRRYYDRLELQKEARSIIRTVRENPPARSGDSSQGSAGDVKSLKMGHWINFASFVPESAAVFAMDVDPDIVEFWEQPAGGFRPGGHQIWPDFLVLRRTSVGWDDWKRQEELVKLAEKHPDQYIDLGGGRWSMPKREEAAKALGLTYRMRSADELPAILVSNVHFLRDYLEIPRGVADAPKAEILAAVSGRPGVSLADLLDNAEQAKADDIYNLLVGREIYADLGNQALRQPETVDLYPSYEHALALGVVHNPMTRAWTPQTGNLVLAVGHAICWKGKLATIMMTGPEKTYLRFGESEDTLEYPTQMLLTLARKGEILAAPEAALAQHTDFLSSALATAGTGRLERALKRLEAVDACATGGTSTLFTTQTIARYQAVAAAAGEDRGAQLLALLPQPYPDRSVASFPEKVERLMESWIAGYYESEDRPEIYASYQLFKAQALNEGVPKSQIPSNVTFWRRLRGRNYRKQVQRRKGSAIADQLDPMQQPHAFSSEQWWWLAHGTPRHGEYFMHRCHIDHTQLDREVIDTKTGLNLGRPWLSILMDARTRRVLAIYLGLEKPSFRTVMRLIRICVRQFGRAPRFLVMDRGAEFKSNYMRRLATYLKMDLLYRTRRKPRAGSVLERLFGSTTAMVIKGLAGNTQASRNPRGMTKQTNPRKRANEGLIATAQRIGAYLYGTYDNQLVHTTLGRTPKDEFEEVERTTGFREQRVVAYNETFRILTMPPVRQRGGRRKVTGRGLKDSHFYYWAEELRDQRLLGKMVEVRYDPDDVSKIWALIGQRWVCCVLRGQFSQLEGMSHAEIESAAEIVRARLRTIRVRREASAVEILREAMKMADDPDRVVDRRRAAANREAVDFFNSVSDDEMAEFPGLPVPGLAPPAWEMPTPEQPAATVAQKTEAAEEPLDYATVPALEDAE